MTGPPSLRPLEGGSQFRGTVPEDELELVPVEARDITDPRKVRWGVQYEDGDPFLAGAYWALGWSLDVVFGTVIGSLLEELTLTNVETWNGQQWVPVA